MKWKNGLIILLAIFLAGVVAYALYLYFGPYRSVSEENQRLRKEIEARQASESKMEKEISQLKATLEETKVELAQNTDSAKNLQTKMEGLGQTITTIKMEKEAVVAEAGQLRRGLEESKRRLIELSQQIQGQKEQYQRRLESLQTQTIRMKGQLQEAKSRLNSLSQEVTGRERRLQEVKRIHETLVRNLEQQIQDKEMRISSLEEKLTIQVLDKILFNPGNAVITAQGHGVLKSVAEELKKLSGIEIRVEGHTDNQPLSEDARAVYIDNLGLSVARAAAVARILRTRGLEPRLLSANGYSMYRPVATNDTPEGRQRNRRVEIVLVPAH